MGSISIEIVFMLNKSNPKLNKTVDSLVKTTLQRNIKVYNLTSQATKSFLVI